MQAEATFSENTIKAKAADFPKVFRPARPIRGLRKFIEEYDWDKRFPKYEKYINRFSWTFIVVSIIYLIPVCLNIFIR